MGSLYTRAQNGLSWCLLATNLAIVCIPLQIVLAFTHISHIFTHFMHESTPTYNYLQIFAQSLHGLHLFLLEILTKIHNSAPIMCKSTSILVKTHLLHTILGHLPHIVTSFGHNYKYFTFNLPVL